MTKKALLLTALGLLLASCGVYGMKGNDTGGIIPWAPESEHMAAEIAQNNCAWYGKHAVIANVHRVPGDYIVYACQFEPPRRRHARR